MNKTTIKVLMATCGKCLGTMSSTRGGLGNCSFGRVYTVGTVFIG